MGSETKIRGQNVFPPSLLNIVTIDFFSFCSSPFSIPVIQKELISNLGQGSVVCNLGMSNEKHYFDLGMDKFAIKIRS